MGDPRFVAEFAAPTTRRPLACAWITVRGWLAAAAGARACGWNCRSGRAGS